MAIHMYIYHNIASSYLQSVFIEEKGKYYRYIYHNYGNTNNIFWNTLKTKLALQEIMIDFFRLSFTL